jgi:hypothetical protein
LKAVIGFLAKVSNSNPWWNPSGKENGVPEIFFCFSPRKWGSISVLKFMTSYLVPIELP